MPVTWLLASPQATMMLLGLYVGFPQSAGNSVLGVALVAGTASSAADRHREQQHLRDHGP